MAVTREHGNEKPHQKNLITEDTEGLLLALLFSSESSVLSVVNCFCAVAKRMYSLLLLSN